jgi:DUF971 family protein
MRQSLGKFLELTGLHQAVICANAMTLKAPTPVGIKAPHGSPWFEVSWADTSQSRIPNAILRGYCPCAGCQGHGGQIAYQTGRDSELKDIEQVGNYALRFVWGDGHGSGLYSFTYLKFLGDLVASHGETLPDVFPVLPPRSQNA